MMRSDWDNMYKASTDVINKGLYNLKTPYNEIFTDDGENSGGSIFELQCTATAALPQSDVIGSQFCEVQGVRGAGQWDLGWGWHMATQLMADAYETGDPRKNATLLYFRKTDDEPITPENTNEPYGESPVSPAMGAYFNKKAYTDPALRKEYTNKGFWVNIRLIRYSDVVLMAAEAANEKEYPRRSGGLSGNGTCTCQRHQYEYTAQNNDQRSGRIAGSHPPRTPRGTRAGARPFLRSCTLGDRLGSIARCREK